MRLIDRLTKEDYRTLGKMAIIAVVVIIFTFIASSCTAHDYPYLNKHSVIIEYGNTETYLFSDFHPDSLYYPEDHNLDKPFDGRVVPNGYEFADGSDYAFWFEGDSVFISVGREPLGVKYYSDAGADVRYLEMKEAYFNRDVFTIEKLHTNGYFVFEYEWID